ncbi:MAG: hypothetical protein AAFZ18_28520 [Myxococcota bacterium]
MPAEAPSKVATLAVVVSVAMGFQGVGFWLLRDRGPEAAILSEAAQRLRERYRPGDALFILPAYATQIREELGDLGPLAARDPLLEDLESWDRAWVISSFGAEERARTRFEAAGHIHVERVAFPGLVVDLFSIGGPRADIEWQAAGAVRELEVAHVYPDGRRIACERWVEGAKPGGPGGRWVCPHDSDWLYVGLEWHRMGERPRRCLWAHPPREGRLELRFPEVPPGTVLAGAGGHTLNASRRAQAPVFLDARFGEQATQRFVFELEDTWRPFRMIVPTSTSPRALVLSVSSPNNGANHFCFDATVRSPRPRT